MESKPADTLEGSGFASAADALAWLVALGADEITLDQPVDRFAESAKAAAPAPRPAPAFQPAPPPPAPAAPAIPMGEAAGLNSIAEIAQALNFFEAHPLRKNAMKLSFFEGPEQARVLVISDHPRKEEDRHGLVFAEKSRLLLTNMLAAIGLRLEDVALMNLIPWRPLGGAAPKPAELNPVLPFAKRAIELVRPSVILAFSALPGQHLANGDASILRQRGRWMQVAGIPMLATLHPEELLKFPQHKRLAWRDLLAFKEKLP
ncbi:MAG: uracil-DNA glycosylase [Alphaproteobacteria bacterium]|nr:uracil-DNA glycosylase [Alphaproteobacteria bacterium]